jgi:hypothetical protein
VSGDRQLASFRDPVGADWSSAPVGGSGTGVDVGGTGGDNYSDADVDISGLNHIVYQKRPASITPNSRKYYDGKASICSEETENSRKFQDILELRSQAESCFQRSELTTDRPAKLRWLTLAEAWLIMADKMDERNVHDGCGASVYQYLQREDEGALGQFLISSRANRRKYRRQQVNKEGKITNSEMCCVADVIIRDLSESGARLQLATSHVLPEDLILHIAPERLLYPAVTRWRDEEALGIQFVGEPRPTALYDGII